MIYKTVNKGWINDSPSLPLHMLTKSIISENDMENIELHTNTLLGDSILNDDKNEEYLENGKYYSYYYLFSKHVKPKVIAEIGTRLGYSLISLIKGSQGSVEKIYSYDLEEYIHGSSERAKANIERETGFTNAEFFRCNTQEIDDLHLDNVVDVFNVDGDHTKNGALHDLEMAYKTTKSGGYILFDDIIGSVDENGAGVRSWGDDLRDAGIEFCTKYNLQFVFLPTLRGLMIIHITK